MLGGGGTPCVLVALRSSTRVRSHAEGMIDYTYRTKEEVAEMREQHDPITNLSKVIVEAGYKTEDELKDLDKEVRAIVAEAAEFAQETHEPDPSELYTDVLVDA